MRVKWTSAQTNRTGPGFTLVELLLALALMLLLVSAMVFSFSTLLRGRQLEEGATQMESLLRFARAQAANTGRKVQLVFEGYDDPDMPLGSVRLNWEPDPLGQPGSFAPLAEAASQVREINGLVQVEEVKLRDANGEIPADYLKQTGETVENARPEPFSPIMFYPDGSSDSAEIILISGDPEDERRVSVSVAGLSGVIRHELVNPATGEGPVDDQKEEAEPTLGPK